MFRVSTVVVLGLCCELASCGARSVREGWVLHDEGAFTLRLPPRFSRVQVQGEDSQVGLFRTGDGEVQISYDYGWYSNDLLSERNSYQDFSSRHEVISGQDALVVTGRLKDDAAGSHNGRYVVGSTWRTLDGPNSQTKLTVYVQMRGPNLEVEMLEMIRSITFDPR